MHQAGDMGYIIFSFFKNDWVECVDAAKSFQTGQAQAQMPLGPDQAKLCLDICEGWSLRNPDQLMEFAMVIYAMVKYSGIIPGFLPDNLAAELEVEAGVYLPYPWADI